MSATPLGQPADGDPTASRTPTAPAPGRSPSADPITAPMDLPAVAELDRAQPGPVEDFPPLAPIVKPLAAVSPQGIPLPIDMRSGPIVVGVDDAVACGRPLRAAVFLSKATGRPLLLVHVRRRAMPMVEGYVPIPEEIGVNDEAEDAVETELVRALTESGDLTGVSWELLSTTGEAGAELVRIAEERDAACVVVGKRHKGFSEFLHRISSGSVSRAIVARQKFPVMVVP
jgi:nucleotide-binding universal stress UspA family protein